MNAPPCPITSSRWARPFRHWESYDSRPVVTGKPNQPLNAPLIFFGRSIPQADSDPELADHCVRGLTSCTIPRFSDPSRALDLARRAARRFPQCALLRSTLGFACYRAGDWQGAISALTESRKPLRHRGCHRLPGPGTGTSPSRRKCKGPSILRACGWLDPVPARTVGKVNGSMQKPSPISAIAKIFS